jgi:heterodisulfide reductase subunit C
MADIRIGVWLDQPDSHFLDEILAMPGGEAVAACIQCGTCSGACPTVPFMDSSPREIMAFVRAGYRDRVLNSSTIWMCVSCYSCYVRCPKEIKITDFMYKLKQIAMREGYKNPDAKRARVLSKEFADNVKSLGRNNEMWLLLKYFLATGIFSALKYTGMGLSLLTTGRLELFPKKYKSVSDVRKIIAKSREEAAMRL